MYVMSDVVIPCLCMYHEHGAGFASGLDFTTMGGSTCIYCRKVLIQSSPAVGFACSMCPSLIRTVSKECRSRLDLIATISKKRSSSYKFDLKMFTRQQLGYFMSCTIFCVCDETGELNRFPVIVLLQLSVAF